MVVKIVLVKASRLILAVYISAWIYMKFAVHFNLYVANLIITMIS